MSVSMCVCVCVAVMCCSASSVHTRDTSSVSGRGTCAVLLWCVYVGVGGEEGWPNFAARFSTHD